MLTLFVIEYVTKSVRDRAVWIRTGAAPQRTAESPLLDRSLVVARQQVHGTRSRSADTSVAATRRSGTDPAGAKTTMAVDDDVEEFGSIKDLVAKLPKDAAMRHHHPRIQKRRTGARRVALDQQSVRLTALLYAARIEDDGAKPE